MVPATPAPPGQEYRVVASLLHRHGLGVHAQQLRIERGGGVGIVGQQFAPVDRVRLGLDPGPDVLLGLPERHVRARGVADDAHAPGVEDVEGRRPNGAAQTGNARRDGVHVVHGDVDHPVGRDARLTLILRLLIHAAHEGAVRHRHRVEDVAVLVHRAVLVVPPEQVRVERLRRRLVGGGQIDPAGGALRMAGDLHRECLVLSMAATRCTKHRGGARRAR